MGLELALTIKLYDGMYSKGPKDEKFSVDLTNLVCLSSSLGDGSDWS